MQDWNRGVLHGRAVLQWNCVKNDFRLFFYQKMISAKTKLVYCIIANFAILCLAIIIVVMLKDEASKYFRFGPNEDLILVSVKVNTWVRWVMSLVVIGIFRVGEVIVNEIGSPILGFSIYNPDKTHITEFTKNELNFLANSMWIINGIRGVFMIVISITQFDLALASVVISEITSIFTIRMLLNEKTFGTHEKLTETETEMKEVIVVS